MNRWGRRMERAAMPTRAIHIVSSWIFKCLMSVHYLARVEKQCGQCRGTGMQTGRQTGRQASKQAGMQASR